jgi:hypothetical protein
VRRVAREGERDGRVGPVVVGAKRRSHGAGLFGCGAKRVVRERRHRAADARPERHRARPAPLVHRVERGAEPVAVGRPRAVAHGRVNGVGRVKDHRPREDRPRGIARGAPRGGEVRVGEEEPQGRGHAAGRQPEAGEGSLGRLRLPVALVDRVDAAAEEPPGAQQLDALVEGRRRGEGALRDDRLQRLAMDTGVERPGGVRAEGRPRVGGVDGRPDVRGITRVAAAESAELGADGLVPLHGAVPLSVGARSVSLPA